MNNIIPIGKNNGRSYFYFKSKLELMSQKFIYFFYFYYFLQKYLKIKYISSLKFKFQPKSSVRLKNNKKT